MGRFQDRGGEDRGGACQYRTSRRMASFCGAAEDSGLGESWLDRCQDRHLFVTFKGRFCPPLSSLTMLLRNLICCLSLNLGVRDNEDHENTKVSKREIE